MSLTDVLTQLTNSKEALLKTMERCDEELASLEGKPDTEIMVWSSFRQTISTILSGTYRAIEMTEDVISSPENYITNVHLPDYLMKLASDTDAMHDELDRMIEQMKHSTGGKFEL